MSETKIVQQILSALKQIPGVIAWRNNTGFRGGVSFGIKGSADIIGVLPGGRALFIEVKTNSGKLHAHQERWLSSVERCGAAVLVARSAKDAINFVQHERSKNTSTARLGKQADRQLDAIPGANVVGNETGEENP